MKETLLFLIILVFFLGLCYRKIIELIVWFTFILNWIAVLFFFHWKFLLCCFIFDGYLLCAFFFCGALYYGGPWNAKLGNVTCYMTVKRECYVIYFRAIIMGFLLLAVVSGCALIIWYHFSTEIAKWYYMDNWCPYYLGRFCVWNGGNGRCMNIQESILVKLNSIFMQKFCIYNFSSLLWCTIFENGVAIDPPQF
jgi:hypothetical protein